MAVEKASGEPMTDADSKVVSLASSACSPFSLGEGSAIASQTAHKNG